MPKRKTKKQKSAAPKYKHTGAHIRGYRQDVGATQSELADALEMSRSAVALVESGVNLIPGYKVMDWVEALALAPIEILALLSAMRDDYWEANR